MPTFTATEAGYGNMWKKAEIKEAKRSAAINIVNGRNKPEAKAQYLAVEKAIGIPFFLVASLHYRESSGNFAGVLHNGEHIINTGRKTKLVPAGRGPFETWHEAAVDALRLKGLQNVKRWSIERMLYEAERFNGFGYVGKGVNSPYVWSWTNMQQSGKYVRDGVFDYSVNDVQPGTAALMLAYQELDPVAASKLTDHEPNPPQDVVDQETKNGKRTAGAGAAGTAVTTGTKVGTDSPAKSVGVSVAEWSAIGVAVGLVLFGAYMVWSKRDRLASKWGSLTDKLISPIAGR
jgi:lysozyme family protein